MLYWKNTNTLDEHIAELSNIVEPAAAELAVLGSKPIDLDLHPVLKGIFKCGVGIDNIPFKECQSRGIAIGLPSENTKEIIFEETANFTVYLILKMLYSELGDLDNWNKHQRKLLNRRKVLIIGLGNIGCRVKNKLNSLMSVLSYDSSAQHEDELESILTQADVVTLHIPLTDETRNWYDVHKLSRMPDNSVLINTSRGQIVNEMDLHKEIKSGRLRAAFDVFWEEPYHGPLRAYHPERFFMTPHVASTCKDFLTGLASDFRTFAERLENG